MKKHKKKFKKLNEKLQRLSADLTDNSKLINQAEAEIKKYKSEIILQDELILHIDREQTKIIKSLPQTNRDKAINRISSLPKYIQEDFFKQRLHLTDCFFTIVKSVGKKTNIRMFNVTDISFPGLGNIEKAMLPRDMFVLCCEIGLVAGINKDPAKTDWGNIPSIIANGSFNFTQNLKCILEKNYSCQIFVNEDPKGPLKMKVIDSPKWLEPQAILSMDISFSNKAKANTNLKFMIKGQALIPY